MAKLLISPPNRFHSIQRAASSAVHIATASPRFRCCPALSQPNYRSFHRSSQFSRRRRVFVAEFSSSSPTSSSPAADQGNEGKLAVEEDNSNGSPVGKGELPSDEFEIVEFDWWKRFLMRVRMLFALPWERVRKGSVLSMKLKGTITDQFKSSFSSGISLPQICENLVKAAHDPRISAVYLQIEPLNCGWGKVEEIRRHILNFRKSGKLIISYVPICGVKEYYLACACEELYMPPSGYVSIYGLTVQASFIRGILDKVGIEPQVQRIGRYKSAGDQLNLKSMSKENCEMLTTLLDNIYDNWLDVISSTQGKNKEEIVNFLDSGVFRVERLKEEGWITNLLYDDEITSMLKKKLGHEEEKPLRSVDFRRYSRVRKWTLGLGGQGDEVAVVRASGSISRARGPLSLPGGSGITSDEFIEKIRSVRESKRYKAVILRIDSPGGDALASDLMWREIRLLAASKPVVASMADVAASGGYYMAMGAQTIVAEKLTLTGSIGVVTGKFNLQKLYERIGFNKEIISRGKYAELQAAEQRPFREDEAELFEKSAQDAYARFRDKAAFSRSMTVDQMETVAQGRVWSGGDAASRGLIDAVGGFSLAVAIAKQKAGIPKDSQVKLVEVTRRSPSLPELVTGFGQSLFGLENAMKDALLELGSSGVQARVDGILFERLGDSSGIPPIIDLIKDCINSL